MDDLLILPPALPETGRLNGLVAQLRDALTPESDDAKVLARRLRARLPSAGVKVPIPHTNALRREVAACEDVAALLIVISDFTNVEPDDIARRVLKSTVARRRVASAVSAIENKIKSQNDVVSKKRTGFSLSNKSNSTSSITTRRVATKPTVAASRSTGKLSVLAQATRKTAPNVVKPTVSRLSKSTVNKVATSSTNISNDATIKTTTSVVRNVEDKSSSVTGISSVPKSVIRNSSISNANRFVKSASTGRSSTKRVNRRIENDSTSPISAASSVTKSSSNESNDSPPTNEVTVADSSVTDKTDITNSASATTRKSNLPTSSMSTEQNNVADVKKRNFNVPPPALKSRPQPPKFNTRSQRPSDKQPVNRTSSLSNSRRINNQEGNKKVTVPVFAGPLEPVARRLFEGPSESTPVKTGTRRLSSLEMSPVTPHKNDGLELSDLLRQLESLFGGKKPANRTMKAARMVRRYLAPAGYEVSKALDRKLLLATSSCSNLATFMDLLADSFNEQPKLIASNIMDAYETSNRTPMSRGRPIGTPVKTPTKSVRRTPFEPVTQIPKPEPEPELEPELNTKPVPPPNTTPVANNNTIATKSEPEKKWSAPSVLPAKNMSEFAQIDDIKRLVLKARKLGASRSFRTGKKSLDLRRRVAELEYRQKCAVSWPTVLCMTTALAYAALFHFVIFRQ